MIEDTHPLKESIIDLATWVDRWRDEPGLETLVDAVREAWMDYVAGSGMFEISRADGKLAEVAALLGQGTNRPNEMARALSWAARRLPGVRSPGPPHSTSRCCPRDRRRARRKPC